MDVTGTIERKDDSLLQKSQNAMLFRGIAAETRIRHPQPRRNHFAVAAWCRRLGAWSPSGSRDAGRIAGRLVSGSGNQALK
mmetsp:Transcript_114407/g.286060  ORF Transcript_114407/g.286060 Transcript_114407/m.286060 type:complete len:81 (+) Transcript_114407:19-261(+)